ncbi:hypothetical protein [Hyalangium minutum]|uniref:Uncharacterized protein n=1 Tax=Hyalangium minutum TaxID=394096 RepID=A0A085WI64_9BACT|nr:hypothetical protein [Hyalangium minutum]KFE67290.1 hypothetical protein DB31_8643 [Hyalangium minutum]KFE67377.1 hypothetical protein DB31_8730 [Hyalangium minutum]
MLDFMMGHYLIASLDANTQFSGHILQCQEDKFRDSLITQRQTGTEIIRGQREFSNTFNIANWERLGHFALTKEALVYLMNSVIKTKLALAMDTNQTFLRTWVRVQAALGNANTPYILAGIRKTSAWTKGTAVDVAHVPKNTDPAFEHWVVIRSLKAASDDSDYYDVEFWTWQRDYTVKFKKSVISSYLACLVYGFLED